MKKIFTLFATALIATSAFAQAPQKMSYQSVIRDANDELLSETSVDVRISIIPETPDDIAVYVELHETMTNINGLISLELGMGNVLFGTFSNIDWGVGPFYIETETVPDDSPGVILTGVSELLSVPYALYAGNAAFSTSENITTNRPGDYSTDDFVFGSPILDNDGNVDHNSRMFFDKSLSAFRAGFVTNDGWDEQNVGLHSQAMGYNSTAIGTFSTALGYNTEAEAYASTAIGFAATANGSISLSIGSNTISSGQNSTAIGFGATASASYSTAIGSNTLTNGLGSTAIGNRTIASSYTEMAVGTNNTIYSPVGITSWNSQDRLFVIGNGETIDTRSDAMVVLKNGNVGFGTSSPNELLEIGGDGRAFFGNGGGSNRTGILIDGDWLPTGNRIDSYDYETNTGLDLVLNDIGNGDVGIKVQNPNVSLDVSGSIEYTGTITDVSDERLKENFETIENPLESISQIQGYSYNMKDDEEKVREYGVIAQEIQKVFPELVTEVDEENGYLGVSYVQLIPILLEAIKEQQGVIAEQHDLIKSNTMLLQELNSILKTQASK